MTDPSDPAADACAPRWSRRLFWLVLAGSLLSAWRYAHVTLDDTYIYLRMVDQALRGNGPRFNPGDAHMPLTGPGWMLVLWWGKALLPAVPLPLLAKTASLLMLALASWCLRGVLVAFPLASSLAPVACFFAPNVMRLMCGYDTTMAMAAGLWLVWCHRRHCDRWLWLAAALFYLARGDGAVFGLVVGAHAVWRRGRSPREWPQALRAMAPGLLVGGALVLGWHLYYALEFGHLLPATLQAKLLQGRAGWPVYGEKIGVHLLAAGGGVWLVPVAAVGAVAIGRRVPQLWWWVAVHSAFFAALRIAYYHWYFYPVDLVALASLLVGVDVAARRLWRLRVGPSALGRTAAVALAGAVLASYAPLRQALFDPPPPDGRYDQYAGFAQLMRPYADARAAAGRPLVVLSHEIGVLGYLLPQVVFADTSGLASPVERAEELNDWALQVERNQPDVIMAPSSFRQGLMVYETSARRRHYQQVASGGAALFVDPDLLPELWQQVDPRLRRLLEFAGPAAAPDRAPVVLVEGLGLVVLAPPPTARPVPLADGVGTVTAVYQLRPDAAVAAGVRFYAADVATGRRLWQAEVRRGAGAERPQAASFQLAGARQVVLGTEPIAGVAPAVGCWVDVKQR